jgi:hypothetical protein
MAIIIFILKKSDQKPIPDRSDRIFEYFGLFFLK